MTDYHYFLRGLIYFLAAFLPSLGASLVAHLAVPIAIIVALGSGAVAVASYMDKTAGKRDCDAPSPISSPVTASEKE